MSDRFVVLKSQLPQETPRRWPREPPVSATEPARVAPLKVPDLEDSKETQRDWAQFATPSLPNSLPSLLSAKRSQPMRMSLPPPIAVNPTAVFRGYYVFSAQEALAPCNRQTIAGAMGFVALSATTGAIIHTSFRIRKITAWPLQGSSSVESFQILWTASTAEQGLIKDESRLQPSVAGGSVPRPVVCVPPKGSYAAMWQGSGSDVTDVLFNISCQVGALLLLEAEVTEPSQVYSTTTLPVIGSVTGLTAGRYYRYSLDTTGNGNSCKSLVASAF